MATASSAAFRAPGAPIASVPTGIPAGICTVESSESRPFSEALSIGTPSTGSTVCAAQTPARCAAPPAAAMITSVPRGSAVAVLRRFHGGAVRRQHPALVFHAKFGQHLGGLAHHFPVRLAAHQDSDQRFRGSHALLTLCQAISALAVESAQRLS